MSRILKVIWKKYWYRENDRELIKWIESRELKSAGLG